MKRALIAVMTLALLMSVPAMWKSSADTFFTGGAPTDGSNAAPDVYVYELDDKVHLNFGDRPKLLLTFFGVQDRGVSVTLDGKSLSGGTQFNDPVSGLMFPRYSVARLDLRRGKGAAIEVAYNGEAEAFWKGTLYADGKDAASGEVEFRAVRLDSGRLIAQTSARIGGVTCPNAKVSLYALSGKEEKTAPTDTATPDTAATATPDTAATATPDPAATVTLDPAATVTPNPGNTATPNLEDTATPNPANTATLEPAATFAPAPDGGAAGGEGFAPKDFGLGDAQALPLKETEAGTDGAFELADLDLRGVDAVALVVRDEQGVERMEYREVWPLTVDSADVSGDMAILRGTGKPGEWLFIWAAESDPLPTSVSEDGRWSYNVNNWSQAEEVRVGYDGSSESDWRAFKLADMIAASQKGIDAQSREAGAQATATASPSAAAGGQAEAEKPVRATIDVEPKPVDGSVRGSAETLRFYGEAQPGSGLTFTIGAVTKAVSAGADGKWEVSLPLSELPTGGPLNPAIAYADGAGQGQGLVPFEIDTGCQLKFDGALDERTASITGTADPGVAVTLYREGAALVRVMADAVGAWEMDLSGAGLAAGESLTLRAADEAGNEAAPVALNVAEYLRAQITLATEPGVNPAGLIGGAEKAIQVSGRASPGEAIEVMAAAASLTQPIRCTAVPDGNGGWSCDVILGGVKDGDRVTLNAAYADGLSTSKKAQAEFAFDTVAPKITLDPPPDASMTILTGTTEPQATVRLRRKGDQPALSAVADASGSFSFGPMTLKEGEVLALEAKDGAGNTGTADMRVDPAPPMAFGSIAVDKPPAEGGDATVSGWFLMSEPGRVYLSLYAQSVKIREELLEGGSPLDGAGIAKHTEGLNAAQAGRLTAGIAYAEQPIRTSDLKQGTYKLRLTAINDAGGVIGSTPADAQLVIEPRPDFLPQKLFILTALFVLALGLVFWYVRVGRRLRQMENAVIDRVNRDSALTIKMRGKTQ